MYSTIIQKRLGFILAATLTLAVPSMQAFDGTPHLDEAQHLITSLLSNSLKMNQYGTPGHIDWNGDPRTAVSECSSFLTMLLKHTYGYTEAAFYAKTGGYGPNAALYHDDILAGKSFVALANPLQLVPGDTIAIKYPAGEQSSGHVMTVQSVATWQPRSSSKQTFLTDVNYPEITGYFDITVIDSSASFHGSTDTRASKPGGIGRNGLFRIYVDGNYDVTGYTWSTVKASAYESPATSGRHLAMGRWIQ